MLSIFKFKVPTDTIGDAFPMELPKGAHILDVQLQHRSPVMWAVVDTDASLERRLFVWYGTGQKIKYANNRHIATVQVSDGLLIWHLFEVEPE